MTDKAVWMHNVSAIIITQLPLQSMDTAGVLVDAYLSDHGGWDDGAGQPNNGLTEQQTADAITEEQYNTIYDLNIIGCIKVDVQMAAKLTANLDINTAVETMMNQIIAFLTNQINNSDLPIRLNSLEADETEAVSARSTIQVAVAPDQTTTASVRQAIASDLAGTDKVFDYKANGLLYARNNYGLDDTWNVVSIYTEPNEPIVMQIKKYASTTYELLDGGSNTTYVLTISPVTYGIVSGIILN